MYGVLICQLLWYNKALIIFRDLKEVLNMYKLMLIEDDIKLSSIIKNYIEKYEYSVFEQKNFNNIEEDFDKLNPHIVILDINLPYYDGFYICRAIRRKSKIPIIITSAREGEMDQVMAIELGADDYIIKPLKLEILLAKIKAAMRRTYGEYATNNSELLEINGLILDGNKFELKYGERTSLLSKNEYKLLKKIIENRDRVITREELFYELWDEKTFVDENTLSVNMTRIREKFNEVGINNVIKTKRGVGYMFISSFLEGGANE